MRDYLNLFPLSGRGDYYPISHEQILAMMSRQRELVFLPGERFSYSNTAYMLLAQVIERAGGLSLGAMAKGRIFDPLEMDRSSMLENFEAIIPGRATGYNRDSAGRPRVVHNYNFDVVGDGQLYATVEDLLRWDEHLHGNEGTKLHDLMLTEGRLNSGETTGYALGLELYEHRGLRVVGHGGSSWGFSTQLVRFVDSGLSIAIASNAGGDVDIWRLVEQVAEHYLADQLEPSIETEVEPEAETEGESEADSLKIDIPSVSAPKRTDDELQEVAGDYFSPELDATYRFEVEEGVLMLRIEQSSALVVTLLGIDSLAIDFYEQWGAGPHRAVLELARNAAGNVSGFAHSSGSERGIVFTRR